MTGTRSERLQAIRAIIREESIRTQSDLLQALECKGIACTQGTVSRDFNDLGLHKLTGGRYYLPEDLHLRHMLQEFMLSQVSAENLLLIKTNSGTAQAVAAAFDAAALPLALGTIAGDDTIMIVSKNAEDAAVLSKHLCSLQKS